MKTYILKPITTRPTVARTADSDKPAIVKLIPPRQPLPTAVIDAAKPLLKLGLDVHLEFIMAVAQKDHANGRFQWSLAGYLRLMGDLDSNLPVWTQGKQPYRKRNNNRRLTATLTTLLQEGRHALPLAKAFALVCERLRRNKPTAREFLDHLKHCPSLTVNISPTGKATVSIRRIGIAEIMKAVLLGSDRALTVEEIMAQARALFGNELVSSNKPSFESSQICSPEILRLAPHTFGLR